MQLLKVAEVFAFNNFLFFRTYLPISHCEAYTHGCLLTNRNVIKSIMRDELKQRN